MKIQYKGTTKYWISILILTWFWPNDCDAQRSPLDNFIGLYRSIRNLTYTIIRRTSSEVGSPFSDASNQGKVQVQVNGGIPFPCNTTGSRSEFAPKSVHKLRPGDIDVIGAMGDSTSAGFGAIASNVFQSVIENRGVSWSGGGQGTWREFLTLPNILKEFNPNLIGYARSDAFTAEKKSQFNVAEGGAMSRDLPFMAEILVKRIKNDPRVDMKNHWKMITVMMGGNDFCSDMCYQSSLCSLLDNHRKDLIEALRIIRDNLPRTLVSVVPFPKLEPLKDLNRRPFNCRIFVEVVCSCIYGQRWRRKFKKFLIFMKEWERLEHDVVYMQEFQRETFAVVYQPFTLNIEIPNLSDGSTDWSYFSTDCFHFSQKGHARFANALWNNLMQPVGGKTTHLTRMFERFLCPSPERPYIATLGNSQ